jgi:hypothetical protein
MIAIHVDGMEIIQSVQNLKNEVELIRGKNTLVRVFLSIRNGQPLSNATVRGQLTVKASGADGATATIESENALRLIDHDDANLASRHKHLDRSLNFRFQGNLPQGQIATDGSSVEYRFELTSVRQEYAVYDVTPEHASLTRSFYAPAPLRVRALGLRYYDIDGDSARPERPHFEYMRQYLEQAFPVARLTWSDTVVDANPGFGPPFSDGAPNPPDLVWQRQLNLTHAQLLAFKTLDVDHGGPRSPFPHTWYYGMVNDPDSEFRGAVQDIQDGGPILNPDIVCAGRAEMVSGYYGAHEIAHCLGRSHPGYCGQSRDDTEYPYPHGLISREHLDSTQAAALKEIRDLIDAGSDLPDKMIARLMQLGHETVAALAWKCLKRSRDLDRNSPDRAACVLALGRGLKEILQADSDPHGSGHVGWQDERPTGAGQILPHDGYYDIMTYCQPTWVSPYTYQALSKALLTLEKHTDAAQAKDSIQTAGRNICIIGTYDFSTNRGEIKYLFTTAHAVNPGEHDRSVQIRLLRSGNAVESQNVRIKQPHGDLPQESGVFRHIVSDPGEAPLERIELWVADHRATTHTLDVDAKDDLHSDGVQFELIRDSADPTDTQYFLKVEVPHATSHKFVARALFPFGPDLEFGQEWVTIGMGWPISEWLYLDKRHALLSPSDLRELANWLEGGSKQQSAEFAAILRVLFPERLLENLDHAANCPMGEVLLIGLDLRAICQETLKETELFQGFVLEDPFEAGLFYYRRLDDATSAQTASAQSWSTDSLGRRLAGTLGQWNQGRRQRGY